jgi:hypothetical protein
MAHNTRPLKRAQDGVAPQYYNPTTDEYEVLLGQDGAARAILYGPDGQPIGTSGNPLQVKAQDTDDVLEQIKTAAQAVATETTLDDVKTAAETLAGTVDNGAAKVTLQGSLPPSVMELAVNDWSELPDPTETPKGATAQLIGTFDVRQNNGAEWVEVVL